MKAWRFERPSIDDPPAGAFTIGTRGVGVVEAAGRDVWHIEPQQHVVISPPVVARENVDAQIW